MKLYRIRVWHEDWKALATKYTFVGEKTNVALAKYAFEYLVPELKRKWTAYKKRTGAFSSEKQSYYCGILLGFIEAYNERKDYCEQEFAVMVVDDPRLDDFINDIMKVSNGSHSFSNNAINGSAFEDGQKDGSKMTIAKVVTEGSANTDCKKLTT